jgi:hypothetical protein
VIDGPNEPVKWGGNDKNTKPTQFLFFPGEMEENREKSIKFTGLKIQECPLYGAPNHSGEE